MLQGQSCWGRDNGVGSGTIYCVGQRQWCWGRDDSAGAGPMVSRQVRWWRMLEQGQLVGTRCSGTGASKSNADFVADYDIMAIEHSGWRHLRPANNSYQFSFNGTVEGYIVRMDLLVTRPMSIYPNLQSPENLTPNLLFPA